MHAKLFRRTLYNRRICEKHLTSSKRISEQPKEEKNSTKEQIHIQGQHTIQES